MENYTHIAWRQQRDGDVVTYAHVLEDKGRAADMVAELMVNPDVIALAVHHYPESVGHEWVSKIRMEG